MEVEVAQRARGSKEVGQWPKWGTEAMDQKEVAEVSSRDIEVEVRPPGLRLGVSTKSQVPRLAPRPTGRWVNGLLPGQQGGYFMACSQANREMELRLAPRPTGRKVNGLLPGQQGEKF